MDTGIQEVISKGFKVRQPQARIYFHVAATMGLEVTRVLDYRPLREDRCFPGLLRSALEKSMEEPGKWLFHGPEVLVPDTSDEVPVSGADLSPNE
jgi:hypothetical protein